MTGLWVPVAGCLAAAGLALGLATGAGLLVAFLI